MNSTSSDGKRPWDYLASIVIKAQSLKDSGWVGGEEEGSGGE